MPTPPMLIQPNPLFLFIADAIIDGGRAQPVAERPSRSRGQKEVRMSRVLSATVAVVLLGATIVRAEWQEPKDGVFSDQQLTNYLAATKDFVAMLQATGKAIEGSNNPAAAMALAARTDAKFKDILAKRNLSEAEWSWLGTKVGEAWLAVQTQKVAQEAQKGLKDQTDKLTADLAKLQKEKADLEAAQKAGQKVLTPEEREQAIKEAKEQQQAALEEAKSKKDEIAAKQKEIAEQQAAAKLADALAKKPPADVAADEREDYIKGKQEEAKAARESIKELQKELAELQKQLKEADARAKAAAKLAEHPEGPSTEEEKARLAKQTADRIAALDEQIKGTQQALDAIKDAAAEMAKLQGDQQDKVPPANVELLRKREKDYNDTFGLKPQ